MSDKEIRFSLRTEDRYGATEAVLVASDGERETTVSVGFCVAEVDEEWAFACLRNTLNKLFDEDRCGCCGR